MSRMIPAALAIATALAAPAAHADPDVLCLPDVDGPAPAWSNPGLSAEAKEARWAGALTRTLVNGKRSVRTRALWGPAAELAYFDVKVKGDPSLDPGQDLLIIGLGDEDGEDPELFVLIDPTAMCANPADCAGAGVAIDPSAIMYAEATAGPTSLTWSDLTSVNPSASFELSDPWISLQQAISGYVWTVSFALAVPVDNAGDIRPGQRIYANALAYAPGFTSGTVYELPVLCTSSSQTSNDCLINPSAVTEYPYDLPYGNLFETWSILSSSCVLQVL